MRKFAIAAFLLPLFLALPFLNRAYFVDDHYFVEIATWLKDNPTLPYHFRADDAGPQNRGWEEDGFVRMVNPLAHHYYLAFLMKTWDAAHSKGNNSTPAPEWFLRLGCVLLSCFAALILFQLARRWTYHPFLTTLQIVLTPVFWLSSYSLLIDSTMTFFALLGLYFTIRSVELDSFWRSVVAGVAIGFAILSKYPAVFMLPLCAVWVLLNTPNWKDSWRSGAVLAIPLVMLFAYSAYTAHLYGRPHILAASARMVQGAAWPKLFSLAVFFSGSLLIPLVTWKLSSSRIRAVSALAGVSMFALLASSHGGFSVTQSFLLALWLATSFAFLGELTLRSMQAVSPYLNRYAFPGIGHYLHENRNDVFLGFWVFGFLLMMVVVMNWVAVRYYCLVAPAVGFLLVRLVERRCPASATRFFSAVVVLLFMTSGALAYIDQQQANPARTMGARLEADGYVGGPRHFYLGDSFTMSYLKDHGWMPAFPQTVFEPGDVVISKEVTMPLIWFYRKPMRGRVLATYDFPSNLPFKVMDFKGSAGFYASVWGALPFTYSWGPWERFRVIEILEVAPHEQ